MSCFFLLVVIVHGVLGTGTRCGVAGVRRCPARRSDGEHRERTRPHQQHPASPHQPSQARTPAGHYRTRHRAHDLSVSAVASVRLSQHGEMVLTSSDASSDYDTFSDLTASQLAELDAVALSSSQRPIRKLPHVAVQLEEEHAEVVPDDGGVELRASLCSSMEEDLVEVIAGLLAPSKETTLQSSTQGPHGAVVGPPVSGLKATKADEADSISLFQQFRPRDFFSVSDLVGPLWCEVQVGESESHLRGVSDADLMSLSTTSGSRDNGTHRCWTAG